MEKLIARWEKYFIAWITGFVLSALVAFVAIADPFKTFDWNPPLLYTNGNPIPSTDTLVYDIRCGATQGGPYDVIIGVTDPNAPPTLEDLGPLVQGQPGDYYCVAHAFSSAFSTWSEASNEANFTVTPGDLGFVPGAPENFQILPGQQ